jgi:peptide/nickel transport system substrate-binding protein
MKMFSLRASTLTAVTCLGLAISGVAFPSQAKTLTWSYQGDIATLDPQGVDQTFTLGVLGNVYEGLIERGPNMEIVPALATSWEVVEPTRWRFHLRKGVTFQGGEPFTADDVVFTVARSLSEGSRIKSSKMVSVKGTEKVDDYTVDIVLKNPNPILISDWGNWYILSKTWAEKNGITANPTLEELTKSYAAGHANGTGPFKVVRREADNILVAAPNETWWGQKTHNLTEVVFRPIASPATRTAALLSGEIDVAMPVPLQDQDRVEKSGKTKVMAGPELRVVFLGLDVASDELAGSDIKGRNPLKDLKVRKAIYQAIDIQSINRVIMRGQATISAAMIPMQFNGFPKEMKRFPYDLAAAKALLAEAGYPNGFAMGLDCPNNRYVNDEKICVAVAGMLDKAGIKVRVNATPMSQYQTILADPKVKKDMWFLGLSPGNIDANGLMQELVHSRTSTWGIWNAGGVHDTELDATIEAAIREGDKTKRDALLAKSQQIVHDQIYFIPLHQQALSWGVRNGIKLIQRPDDVLVWKYVVVE